MTHELYPNHPEQIGEEPGRLLEASLKSIDDETFIAGSAMLDSVGLVDAVPTYQRWQQEQELLRRMTNPVVDALEQEIEARAWEEHRAAIVAEFTERDPSKAAILARMARVAESGGASLTAAPKAIYEVEDTMDEMSRVIADQMPALIEGYTCSWIDGTGIYLTSRVGTKVVEIVVTPNGADIERRTITTEVLPEAAGNISTEEKYLSYVQLKDQANKHNEAAVAHTEILGEDTRPSAEAVLAGANFVLYWVRDCNQSRRIL